MIEVPNRNAPIQYDLKQVESQQLAATNAVFAGIKVVNEHQKITAEQRTAVAKTTLALNFSTAQ